MEAALDDPEHYSLDGFSQVLREKNEDWLARLRKMIASAADGRLIQEGIQTAIIGKPNVGKSSLLNRLMGEERAIVTDIAGTTRDTLRETLQLGDMTLVLTDTAGIRSTQDQVEQIGVERAVKSAEAADLVLFVVDASAALEPEDGRILKMLGEKKKKTIVLLNKSDLKSAVSEEQIREMLRSVMPEHTGFEEYNKCNASETGASEITAPEITASGIHVLSVSALDGSGMDNLEKLIRELFYHGELSFNDEIFITNVRQKNLLEEAVRYLENVRESIDSGMPEDFYTIDMNGAYGALGGITGESVGEDLVDEIFSRFCMGK